MSRKQEVVYETLPAYSKWRMQGHNKLTCRAKKGEKLGKARVGRKELNDTGANGESAKVQVTVPYVVTDLLPDFGDQKRGETVNGEQSGGEPEEETSGAVVIGDPVNTMPSAILMVTGVVVLDLLLMEQVTLENEVEKENDDAICVTEYAVISPTDDEKECEPGQMGIRK